VPITCSPACGANQRCFAGQCQASMCTGVTCGTGFYCDPPTGSCLASMCVGKTCAYCAPATGECTINPCGNVQCPFCYACDVDPNGQPSCLPQGDSCNALKIQSGNAGGGCACSVDDNHGAPSALASLFALGAFGLVMRRRRRHRS
jgi:MYXO-CTERM domain-containing protein